MKIMKTAKIEAWSFGTDRKARSRLRMLSAVFRRLWSRSRGLPSLQRFHAHQETSVLPEKVQKEPPLADEQHEHNYPNRQDQQLSSGEGTQPSYGARANVAFPTLPDQQACNGGEHSVACKGLPPNWGGVQLPEAVTLRLASAGQVDGDPSNEHQQKC
jgi:hypothetical protein